MLIKKACVLLLFFIVIKVDAQIDSLKAELSNCTTDKAFTSTYLSIAKSFLNKDNDSVLFYAEKANSYTANYLKGQASVKNIMASAYFRKGDYILSRTNFLEALKIATTQSDSLMMGAYLNNIGLTHTYQGNYEEALSFLMRALSIRENIKDPKISSTYNNIGLAYERFGQLKKATKFQLLALKEKQQQGNNLKISNTLNNLGIIFRKRELYDSSFYFYDRALKTALKSENLSQISNAYNNLGFLFFKQDKVIEAEQYYNKAIRIKKKLGNTYELRNSYASLCKLYLKKGNKIKAQKYFNLAEAQKDSLDAKGVTLSQLQLKVRLDSLLGNYQAALKNSEKVHELYKEIINEENLKNIEELNTKYETEKKAKEIQILEAETIQKDKDIAFSNLYRNWAIVFSILLTVTLILLYNRYKIKRKMFFQKEKIFQKEKEELNLKAQLNKKELQLRDVELSSVAMRSIQKNKMLVDLRHKIKLLNEDKEVTKELFFKSIDNHVKSGLEIDNQWETFQKHFNNVHPDFFNYLNKEYPKLTHNDLKSCAYIRMNLSSKEVSILTNTEPKSVKMHRYRLKKKLELNKEDDLKNFLFSL